MNPFLGEQLFKGFKKFFRWIVPIVKQHAAPIANTVGKEALKSAVNIATDTIDGKDFSQSTKIHLTICQQFMEMEEKKIEKGYKSSITFSKKEEKENNKKKKAGYFRLKCNQ